MLLEYSCSACLRVRVPQVQQLQLIKAAVQHTGSRS